MTREEKSFETEILTQQIREFTRSYNKSSNKLREEDVSSLLNAVRELEAAVTPTEEWSCRLAAGYQSSIAMCLFLDWKIPSMMSKTEEATMSLDQLAEALNVSKGLVRCLMRECVMQQILHEPSPEVYQLNRHSRGLLQEGFAAWVHYISDVGLRTGAYVSEYVSSISGRLLDCPHRTPFQMGFQTEKTFYDYYDRFDKARGARFDRSMEWQSVNQLPVEQFFDFSQLPAGAVVVDIGGGKGHISLRIARQHPQLSFVVQDYEVKSPTTTGDDDSRQLLQRVQWQAHSFLERQPVQEADVYLMSNILMDRTLTDAREIIRHTARAMTPNKSLLLVDDLIDPKTAGIMSASANWESLHMLACFGTLAKSMEEWRNLFSQACPELEIVEKFMISAGRVCFVLRKTA
ncbi:Winged helix-turn-helix transcription repressor DNA-binding [Penicillium expansum]|uniref:Winged helix-turn-helix transcription repressor DNA-binding n=1 Tax=Penicillium expansum TaxID=27334 RepID=A0A0A2JAF2_PENEN|nr:Winged helix-turn-helix transcription repressor DNA-binding [Penicillium expansum]KGO43217.1 Winged helix-turn-helix transcription repressor DNA-binding [Penicillium expansum]KGO47959.1 Winged helix-turn-helix transcription repressor DNA-binding [Penicillium expansum]KGO52397.1 Winged helix-turn-helix transcription repressor DNA-binding [Penicillium expansum]